MVSTLVALVMMAAPETCSLSGTLKVKDASGKVFEPEHAEVYVDTALEVTPRQQEREMGQKGRAFVPRILVVEKEDVVVFKNYDKEPHEIHAAKIKNTFVSGSNQKVETFQRTFDEVGESTLGCRIHKHMSGTILTVPNAFHVRVDKDGRWSLTGLPKQPLKVVFWQRTGLKTVSLEKELTPCVDVAPLDVVLENGSAERVRPTYGNTSSND